MTNQTPNQTFHVTVPVADEELAADRLWQLGVEAVGVGHEIDGEVELWTSVGASPAAIERAVAALEPGWRWRTADVVAPDETWRDYVAPTWYRPDGVVVPSWQVEGADLSSARHVTLIEPASSFGLGDHPTTKLSLRLLAELLDRGIPGRLLDVGCGSGVLGILAAQRGVEVIRSTDISAGAVEATVSNATLNGVIDNVTVDMATLDALTGPYDVVMANILAPVLIKLAPDLRRLVSSHGTVIVSGILADDHEHVLAALEPLEVVETISEDGWAAVRLALPAG